MRFSSKFGHTAAGTTMLAALLTPFLLMGYFSKAFVALGLHVDRIYSGGEKLRTISRGAYFIDVHAPVYPRLLQNEKPFIQLDWTPASALPHHVADTVDADGDGQPDVLVSFDVPSDAKSPLHVDVVPLNPRYAGMRNVGKERFSRLIVRVDNRVIVRFPALN